MTSSQKVDLAISLIHEADRNAREALKLLGTANYARLAAEDIVDAQGHLMDAITHMQNRPTVPAVPVKPKMQYNVCKCCGAKDGHAGPLINDECMNCSQTTATNVVVHAGMYRTQAQIARMIRKKKKLEKVS